MRRLVPNGVTESVSFLDLQCSLVGAYGVRRTEYHIASYKTVWRRSRLPTYGEVGDPRTE